MVFVQHMIRNELRKLITVITKAYQLIYLESFQFISYFSKILVSAVHHSSTAHNDVSTGENQLSVVRDCSFNKFAATLNISGRLDLYQSKNLQLLFVFLALQPTVVVFLQPGSGL
jgi:hypothetical protein